MSGYDSYVRAAERGPLPIFWKVFWTLIVVIIVVGVVGYGLGWFGEAADVAKKEFGPQAALDKYEWFKEQWQMIQKSDRDVEIFRQRLAAVDTQYAAYGEPAQFSPDIRMMYNKAKQQANDDLVAIISTRNALVRDYMAASSKFNWEPFKGHVDQPPQMISEIVP